MCVLDRHESGSRPRFGRGAREALGRVLAVLALLLLESCATMFTDTQPGDSQPPAEPDAVQRALGLPADGKYLAFAIDEHNYHTTEQLLARLGDVESLVSGTECWATSTSPLGEEVLKKVKTNVSFDSVRSTAIIENLVKDADTNDDRIVTAPEVGSLRAELVTTHALRLSWEEMEVWLRNNTDYVRIVEVEPSWGLLPGSDCRFRVTVEYNLFSLQEGQLNIGFNTGEPDQAAMLSEVAPVMRGSGTHVFEVTARPTDWNAAKQDEVWKYAVPFVAYVNISKTLADEGGYTPLGRCVHNLSFLTLDSVVPEFRLANEKWESVESADLLGGKWLALCLHSLDDLLPPPVYGMLEGFLQSHSQDLDIYLVVDSPVNEATPGRRIEALRRRLAPSLPVLIDGQVDTRSSFVSRTTGRAKAVLGLALPSVVLMDTQGRVRYLSNGRVGESDIEGMNRAVAESAE